MALSKKLKSGTVLKQRLQIDKTQTPEMSPAFLIFNIVQIVIPIFYI